MLLSLLWACNVLRRDLLPGLVPDRLPPLERQALPFLLTAFLVSLVAVRRKRIPDLQLLFGSIVVGLGLFVLPAWLLSCARNWVPPLTRAALLTLVPVFALVFEPYIGRNDTRSQNHSGIFAALAAVTGTFLVLPVMLPQSTQAGAAFCAVVLAAASIAAANCKAVSLVQETSATSTTIMAACATTVAALAFTSASLIHEYKIWRWDTLAPELSWSVVIEVPALLLLFWLMHRMSASQMATRYIWALLFPVLIGNALLRGKLSWTVWLGLLLMAAGAAYLLRAHKREPESVDLFLR